MNSFCLSPTDAKAGGNLVSANTATGISANARGGTSTNIASGASGSVSQNIIMSSAGAKRLDGEILTGATTAKWSFST